MNANQKQFLANAIEASKSLTTERRIEFGKALQSQLPRWLQVRSVSEEAVAMNEIRALISEYIPSVRI